MIVLFDFILIIFLGQFVCFSGDSLSASSIAGRFHDARPPDNAAPEIWNFEPVRLLLRLNRDFSPRDRAKRNNRRDTDKNRGGHCIRSEMFATHGPRHSGRNLTSNGSTGNSVSARGLGRPRDIIAFGEFKNVIYSDPGLVVAVLIHGDDSAQTRSRPC
jgi:hypothetical protein